MKISVSGPCFLCSHEGREDLCCPSVSKFAPKRKCYTLGSQNAFSFYPLIAIAIQLDKQ